MNNENNEPKAGCSILIGCGSVILIILIIFSIVVSAALSGYMTEIDILMQAGDQERLRLYLDSIMADVYREIDELGLDILLILVNVAQIVVIFFVFKLIYKRPISQMGLSMRKWLKWLGLGLITGIVAVTMHTFLAVPTSITIFSDFDIRELLTLDVATSLILLISVGFAEEILCRGFLMTVLKTTRNKVLIIALPAMIFGLLQIYSADATTPGVINHILKGLAFAYMFIKTGSLWMPIGFHISWNFFRWIIFGIQTSGLELSITSEYNSNGSEILAGYGIASGLIYSFVILCLLSYIHFGVKNNEPPWTMESDLPFN